MEDTYENVDSFKRHGRKSYDSPTASSPFNYKIIISTLGLLMLGALTALCAVGILYHYKVIFTEIVSEKYKTATDTLVLLEKENSEGSMYEMKYQELISVCNETERLHKELKEKYTETHEQLSACSETERLYDELKVKYKEGHERLSACSNNQNCKPCGEGWKPLGLKCYYFSTEKLSWEQSRDHCVKKGGHLVIITSQTEQKFVSSQIQETHWIGLNDLETEGEWMWVNNQSLNETSVKFWFSKKPVQPDNWKDMDSSGENCAALGDRNGNTDTWFDASCRTLKKCVCEK